jgi:hypothetical protein
MNNTYEFSAPTGTLGRTEKLFQTALKAGFDHLIKGDVIIKKLSKYEYRITFSKVYGDRFFFYQVFNKDNIDNVNDQRFAAYIPLKNAVNMYKDVNDLNTLLNKPLFIPTTIMELDNFHKYAFVINNMHFNSHNRLVFMASTKEINNKNTSSKKLTHIPCGKFKHVRFDIDDYELHEFPFFNRNNSATLSNVWSQIVEQCERDDQKTTFKGDPVCPVPPLVPECSNIIFENSNKCFIEKYYNNKVTMPSGFSLLMTNGYLGASCTK